MEVQGWEECRQTGAKISRGCGRHVLHMLSTSKQLVVQSAGAQELANMRSS
jgi:hypothetical protein